jgi:hypothetical protein
LFTGWGVAATPAQAAACSSSTQNRHTATASGTAKVGQTLTAKLTASSGTLATPTGYTWYRAGTAISGATAQTYVVTPADLSATLTVAIAAKYTYWGTCTFTKTSAATAAVAAGDLVTATPTISGTAKVGATLTAATGSWSPVPSFTYQWKRSGVAISGATLATYVPTAADAGSTLSVSVSGALAGYNSATTTSGATAAVASGDLTTATPTISGSAKVGATLTASPGAWEPAATVFTYQWNRAGAAISGATSTTYVPTTADLGAALTVSVTGTLSGYATATKTSAATAVVANGTFTTAVPVISGTTKVGNTLTAVAGSWTPAGATFTYQWYRGATAISGATASTYALVPADAGTAISVAVTASATGYASATVTSAAAVTISNGTFATVTPTISGTAKVGSTLTATTGTWTPVPANGYTYAWLRDGTAISGATSATYTLTTADAGRAITVQVSGTGTGYDAASATSAAIGVASGTITTVTPTISGAAQVGKVLTAATGTWSPMPSSFTYAWLRDGTAIVGATSGTYTLVADDFGHGISVQVSGTVTGYATATATSAATASVTAGAITTAKPTISGTAQVGQTLTAGVAGWSPMPASFAYSWVRNGTAITGATNATYTLTSADLGATISVIAAGSVSGYATASSTSDATAAVVAGTFSSGTPVISGNASLGSTLTVTTGTWTPAPDSFAYSWLRDGTAISAATASTYVLGNSDIGARISVKVTAVKAGFTNASVTSAETATVGAGTFRAGVPTISGWPAVGSQLTATTGTWTPTPDSLAFAWLRDGTAISGATSSTYTLTSADKGHLIGIKVTATKAGFVDASATTNLSSTIGAGTFSASGSASISGTAKVGVAVTAVPPTWTPAPASYAYQWYAAGLAISGATSVSYTPVAADATKALTVIITAHTDGFTDATATSAAVTVAAGTITTATPTISGTPTVGQTLTAATGTWSPAPSTFDYQWYADGTAIGTNSSSCALTASEQGKAITVKVTGHLSGYSDATATSPATTAVSKGTITTGSVSISGSAAVGQTLTAAAGTWSPVPTLSYSWLRDGVAISGATAATYTVVTADLNTKLTVTVTGALAGYTTASVTSAATATVASGAFATATPAVNGTMQVGNLLTVVPGTWAPAPAFSYQWYRDGAAISGATASTYTLVAADQGTKVTVVATGTASGYASASVSSVAGAAVTAGVFTTVVPTISGTAVVGGTLVADAGTWTPAAGFAYSWLRGDTAISGATNATYVVTTADLGAQLSVKVTGTKSGYTTASVTSASTAAVAAGAFTATPAPTVSGTAAVGSTLTASAGTWTPTPSSFTWAWYRDGVAISGATASTYTLVAADYGHTITVKATAHLTGYADTTTTSAGASVQLGTFTSVGAVSVAGSLAVGQTLTAASAASVPAADSVGYQWYRGSTAISGATSASYVVALADLGTTLKVVATAARAGYTSGTASWTASSAVANGSLTPGTPAISGTATVGSTLTAATGTWTPTPAGYDYQWFADSTAIDGATGSTLILTADQAGAQISVRVTANVSGYNSLAATSAKTATVTAGSLIAGTVTISGTAAVGQSLTAATGTWLPTPTSFTYQWKANGTAIANATDATYVPTASDIGKTLTVQVTGHRSGYTDTTVSAAVNGQVVAGTLRAGSATVSGTTAVGETLTLDPGTWTPTPSFSYQWYCNGTIAIAGATGPSWKLTAAEYGCAISLKVTGTKPGYNDKTITVGPTATVDLGTMNQGTIWISGTLATGQTLTAEVGTWDPMPTFTYTWFRGEQEIVGATGATYVVQADDVFDHIRVQVAATLSGYEPVVAGSPSTEEISAIAITPGTVSITGSPVVGNTLGVTTGTWSPSDTALAYRWYRDGSQVSSDSSYTLTSADLGATMSVVVHGAAVNYAWVEAGATASGKVVAGTITTTVPVITGTAQVGQTLQGSATGWSPAPSMNYAWLRNGVAISGATSTSYTLTAADQNAAITFRASGTLAGYTDASVTSAATAVVVAGTIAAGDVAISGTAQVGETLTVTPGTWTPTPALAYQWYRSGTPIADATAASYTATGADLGATLGVVVTGTLAGYTDRVVEKSTTTILAGVLKTDTPTVDGVLKVGRTVTANPGDWTPGTTFTYAWYRGSKEIAGETDATYTLTASEHGKAITVEVTGAKAGYTSVSKNSFASDPVAKGDLTAGAASITGTATVGQTLTAAVGADWTAGLSYNYSWLRDGDAITGATGDTYVLAAADQKHAISVRVTGSLGGAYSDASVTSATTASVAGMTMGTVPASGDLVISGDRNVGSTLAVDPGTWVADTTLSYQWYAGDAAISGATKASYQLGQDDLGQPVWVKVTGSAPGYEDASVSSQKTAQIAKGQYVTSDPVVAGAPTVGEKLTLSIAGWNPQPSARDTTYEWFASGLPISGAHSASYTPTAAEAGKQLSVHITADSPAIYGYVEFVIGDVAEGTLSLGSAELTGGSRVGQTLSVDTSDWAAGVTVTSYRWLRDGQPISGATGSSYTLNAADQGHVVSVEVSAAADGYTASSITLKATSAISGLALVAGSPTVSGTARVGSTLSASPGTWSPAPRLSYQWLRNGAAIPGATGATYQPTAADAGTRISVNVTGTLAGYEPTSRASAGVTIAPQYTYTPVVPTITGVASVGKVLQASVVASVWAPRPEAFSYQWLANGTPIAGATAASYKVAATDLGKLISVRVTASGNGYASVDVTSPAIGKVIATPANAKLGLAGSQPTLSGVATVNKVLKVKPGKWSSKTRFTYQWYRNGVAIRGAKKAAYKLVEADYATTVTVLATGKGKGKTSGLLMAGSAPSRVVAAGAFVAKAPKISGKAKVGSSVKAVVSGWKPTPSAVSYTWLRNGKVISGATGASYKLTAADARARLQVKIVAARRGWITRTLVSSKTAMVK